MEPHSITIPESKSNVAPKEEIKSPGDIIITIPESKSNDPKEEKKSHHGASTKIKATAIDISKRPEWYYQIWKTLEHDKDVNDMGVSIFRVPDNVAAVKREAYVPQLIGLGHYHHFDSELHDMENHKLAAVKRVTAAMFGVGDRPVFEEFQKIVQKISKLKCAPVCDAYRRDLENHNHPEMAYIMAIDGLFLADLFQTNKGSGTPPQPQRLQPQPQPQRQPDPHAILKDVLKLENQIPMSVLKAINSKVEEDKKRPDHLKFRPDHSKFRGMLVKFCNDVAPIDLDWESTLPRGHHLGKSFERRHLLDLLYHYIAGKDEEDEDDDHQHKGGPKPDPHDPSKKEDTTNCQPISNVLTKLSEFAKLGSLVKHLQQLTASMLFFIPTSSLESWKEKKVLIPSVSELHSVGVEFKPIPIEHGGGTQKVEFDKKTKTFYLPVVVLKPTTEVALRNLVAYETLANSNVNSSNFKRYTELMSAIVDTVDDVKILIKAQVLVFRNKKHAVKVPQEEEANDQASKDKEEANDQASKEEEANQGSKEEEAANQASSVQKDTADASASKSSKGKKDYYLSEVEIADMFNGMTKTMESKDRVIDKAIRKANKCYDNTKKVKAYRMMMRYVFSSWKMFTLIASLLLLLLNVVQTFCDLYDCPAMLRSQGQGITSTQLTTGRDLLLSFADSNSHLSQS
ncbi:hypothetical protein CCACVL1_08458 [Corchorus capsularis]|uniref:Uncharacterized protein n=1 Tax=Corchorus capsularis TaxID=210143 RepID=A0A1R3J0J8_COCAP|nr:hypothetical protein CCACVL1_08458 [Corchorus capsularis]